MNIINRSNFYSSLITKCVSSRYYSKKIPGGIEYQGFTYYPRTPDFQDPPYEPSKLLMVRRIKPVKGNKKTEKKILKEFKLDGKQGDVTVLKNTPSINKYLWKIKHIVEILPVTFPNGEPTAEDAEVLGATFLNEYGEMSVNKKLHPIALQPGETQVEEIDLRKPSRDTIRRHLRLKWTSGFL